VLLTAIRFPWMNASYFDLQATSSLERVKQTHYSIASRITV